MQLGFKIDEVKSMFFDRVGLLKVMSEATFKALSKAGAFIRRSARDSIRKGKKSSHPDRPPVGHGAELLKSHIYFGFDQQNQSVVVGPARLNGRSAPDEPRTLELGGPTVIPANPRRGQFAARKVTLAARPYMQPSLNKNLPKLSGVYADSIRA